MLIISIIILLVIAGGIYFLSRSKSQSGFAGVPVASDVPAAPAVDEESLKQSQLNTLAEKKAAKAPIDSVPAETQEVAVKAEDVVPQPELEEVVEEYEITEEEFQSEVAAGSTEVSSEDVGDSKPARKKKKRYYKPRAKK